MNASLKKKVGPLPLYGWLIIGGGTLGIIFLWSKSKATAKKTALTPEQEANEAKRQQLEEIVQGLENAASAGTNTPSAETGRAAPEPAPSASGPAIAPVETPAPATTAAPAVSSKSKVPARAAVRKPEYGKRNMNIETLSGKRGPEYRTGKYKGLPAHIYDAAVKGGVGPHKNIIVLNATKKTHAAPGKHEPAAAKDHTPTRHHVTTRTPRKPPTPSEPKAKAAPKPKAKVKPRSTAKTQPPKKKVKH